MNKVRRKGILVPSTAGSAQAMGDSWNLAADPEGRNLRFRPAHKNEAGARPMPAGMSTVPDLNEAVRLHDASLYGAASAGQMVVNFTTEGAVRRFLIVPPLDPQSSRVATGKWVEKAKLRVGKLTCPAIVLDQPFELPDGSVLTSNTCLMIDARAAVYRLPDGRLVYSPRTNPNLDPRSRAWLKAHPAWPPKHAPAEIVQAVVPDAVTVELPVGDLGPYSRALECQLHATAYWRKRALALPHERKIELIDKGELFTVAGLQDAFAERVWASLEECPTYHVRTEIVQTIGASVPSVPDDAALHADELPSHEGYMWLEEGFEMPCHAPTRHVETLRNLDRDTLKFAEERDHALHTSAFHRIRAISWIRLDAPDKEHAQARADEMRANLRESGSVRVRVDPSVSETTLVIGGYGDLDEDQMRRLTPDLDDETQHRINRSAYVMFSLYVDHELGADVPILRDMFTWMDGQTVTERLQLAGSAFSTEWTPGERDEDANVHLVAARKFIAGLLSFVRQKLSATTERPPNSLLRKRLDQANKRYQAIRIIHLRERERREAPLRIADGEPTGRHLSHRFFVRRHPRNQHYASMGPARRADGSMDPATHRLRWVEAFEKGPKGAPWKPSRTLFAIVR